MNDIENKNKKLSNDVSTRIGPKMQIVVKSMKKKVFELTKEVIEITNRDACEIIAEKMIEAKLI